MAAPPPQVQRGIIKQVLSGDAVIIRGQPRGGPPPERQLCLSNIVAPRVARRATNNVPETKDEPYGWEAREFLRKKCIGKEVAFTIEYKVPASGREYGCLYIGSNTSGENVTESLITAGLVEVRRAGIKAADEGQQRLIQLEDQAKSSGVGKWAAESADSVRDITWNVEDPRRLVEQFKNKPINAVIEHVRDGCTVRAFLLPEFQYVTVMLSGIKAAMTKPDGVAEPFAAEAKYFVESRLLQRDVDIVIEGVSNNNVLGTVLHPNGNITEMLLKEGFARCVDWSMGVVTQGADKYRKAEKLAKDARLKIWKNWTPSAQPSLGSVTEKEYSGKVVEVVNGDSLMIRVGKETRKVFLSSVRPPRPAQVAADSETAAGEPSEARKRIRERTRPLYDVPYMFEAREFLRKKLVGKKVQVKVDYVQPPSNNFPEKVCCTVSISGVNIGEALISKGLATAIRYRQDDDQRSGCYDNLLAAEAHSAKKSVGLHSKNDPPIHRIQDMTTNDAVKARQFLPFLTRQNEVPALVEFVASGSRCRVYIPKETCLLNFLLNGIQCPRGERPAPGPGGQVIAAEPFGDEAMTFTKEQCLQKDVSIKVDTMDKGGNFIGWMFVDGVNMSVALVEQGLAKIHFSAENSAYARQLAIAEGQAKSQKLGLWKNFVEEIKEAVQEVEDTVTERSRKLERVIITDVSESDLLFHAQKYDNGPKFEAFMNELRSELKSNPPVRGAYKPKRGDLCVATFEDGLLYRAKVDKIDGEGAQVTFIDFGNKYKCPNVDTSPLPSAFVSLPPQAKEYRLACVQLPPDADFVQDAVDELFAMINNKVLSMNIEYKGASHDCVSLYSGDDNSEDVALSMLENGFLLVETRRERRLQKLVQEYRTAQNNAKKGRLNLWQYGDITEDDAREFGTGK